MISGVQLIAEERERQIRSEGWTPEHDDKHCDGELGMAANAYVVMARKAYSVLVRNLAVSNLVPFWNAAPASWPWDKQWWKPSEDPIRNLVKAGALIAAEIDRLQRAKGAHRG